MAPTERFLNLSHRVREHHPLRGATAWSLRRTEGFTAVQITAYQERRLRLLVRFAARRSPFYRSWFHDNGVDPRSIRTLADLRILPLLQRADLAAQPEAFRAYPRRMLWTAHSSGTSGRVVTCYRTPGSSMFEQETLRRQSGWFGVPSRSRRVIMRGSGFVADHPGTLTMEVPGAQQLLVSSFHLDAESLPLILSAIHAFAPDAIEGWPSSIALLATLLESTGQRLPVRAVVTSSEVMSQRQLALLRRVYDAPVVDYYGQTERVAMAGGCEAGGYHVFPDYSIVELLPVEGRPGRREIVGTPLHNWGFPLLRYRTGDEVGEVPDTACGCGRAFPLIGAVDGRTEECFTSSDGRALPLPSTTVDDLPGLAEVQIAQLRPGVFEIRLVPGAGYDAAAVRALARRNVARLFGADQVLRFREVRQIPRGPSGKLQSIVLERPAPA